MRRESVLRLGGLSTFGSIDLAVEIRHAILHLLFRLLLNFLLLLDHVPGESLLDRHRLLLLRWSILPTSTEEHRAQQASRQRSHVEPSQRNRRESVP